jgi:NitT/TauT family transport system substrate-binding protein
VIPRLQTTLLVGLSLLVIGCAQNKSSKSTGGLTRVRVQLNWFPEPEFGGLYAAQKLNLFRNAGLDVQLIKGGPSVPASQMVAQGTVEFAVIAGPQLVTLRAQGGKATAVFATFQKYPRAIIVHDPSPYKTLKQLWESDAKIMGHYGLAFMQWLEHCYGKPKATFVPYTGSMAPFIAGRVEGMQCFATAEPLQLEIEGIATRTFLIADTNYNPYVGIIAVNDRFLKQHPEMVARFVTALREGWRQYLDSPGPTNELLVKLNPDMTAPLMERAAGVLPGFVESETTHQQALGWMEARRWEALATKMAELGELTPKGKEKAGTVFYNPPLTGTAAGAAPNAPQPNTTSP